MSWHAFYDPSSRRVKIADIPYSSGRVFHLMRFYEQKEECYFGQEPERIHSKEGKTIGFGVPFFKPKLWMRRFINAENAVVDFRPNQFFDERDPFAEVCAGGWEIFLCYWWLTETWEDFVKQVKSLNWPIIESVPLWNGDPFVWEGNVNGKPEGDCIVMIDDEGDPAGFNFATENIPKCIPDSQSS